VARWQERVGADSDGILGPASVEAIQRKLCEMGYGVGIDGYLGNESAAALQRSLNDGRWA
jgi:lysozyme family protein